MTFGLNKISLSAIFGHKKRCPDCRKAHPEHDPACPWLKADPEHIITATNFTVPMPPGYMNFLYVPKNRTEEFEKNPEANIRSFEDDGRPETPDTKAKGSKKPAEETATDASSEVKDAPKTKKKGEGWVVVY